MTTPRKTPSEITATELDGLIEEATVDCYNDSEQATGLFTMLEEHLVLPSTTTVLGMPVTITCVDVTTNDEIVAICANDGHRQTIRIRDLPVPDPAPDGWEWVEAYRHSRFMWSHTCTRSCCPSACGAQASSGARDARGACAAARAARAVPPGRR